MTSIPSSRRRSYWLKTLHQWHWISAALSLSGLVLFAVTGLTLNNAAWIAANPKTISRTLELPASLVSLIAPDSHAPKQRPLPGPLQAWLGQQLDINIGTRTAEFSSDEIYLSLPEPGADAWLSIDVASGAIEYERSSRGWVAYFNDLHKGRHAGAVWSWFIDIFALACLVFALTGLFLVKLHAANRPASWPLVSLGLVLPVLVMLLFVH